MCAIHSNSKIAKKDTLRCSDNAYEKVHNTILNAVFIEFFLARMRSELTQRTLSESMQTRIYEQIMFYVEFFFSFSGFSLIFSALLNSFGKRNGNQKAATIQKKKRIFLSFRIFLHFSYVFMPIWSMVWFQIGMKLAPASPISLH